MEALLFIIFLLFVYSVTQDKSIINPISLYVWIWIPILLFSSLEINKMKLPSTQAYIIIFIGTLFFILGNIMRPVKIGKRNNIYKSYEINYKILITFEIISIIVLLPQAVTSLYLMKSGYSLGNIHNIFISSDYSNFYSNRSLDIFFYLFVYPTLYSSILFASYDMWFGKKHKLLQGMTVLLVAMRVVQFGGRAPVFYLCFAHVIGGVLRYRVKRIYLENRSNESFVKTLKKMFPLLITGAVGLVYSVISRLINGLAGVSDMLLEYFAACPVIMSEKLKLLNDNIFTCGLFSTFGFYQYINKLIEVGLKLIGVTYESQLYKILFDKALYVEKGIDIGSGMINAFVTPYYYFFCDAWYIGVILFSFIWGILCKRVYCNYYQKADLKSFYFLLFFLFSVGFSMTGCWLSSPQTALALPFFFLFVKRKVTRDGV